MPPHVTLIHPFVDSRELGPCHLEALDRIARATQPMQLQFTSLGAFERGVWLAVDEPAPVRRLIGGLFASFPEHPPFGGDPCAVIPHVTLAKGPPHLLAKVARAAAGLVPLASTATRLGLFGRSPEGWIELWSAPLGGMGAEAGPREDRGDPERSG